MAGHLHVDRAGVRWIFHIHHFCIVCLYIIFLLCIFTNLYVLLSRTDTIYYLRIYHVIVGGLMIACGIVMAEFMYRTRSLPKLDEPHEMPKPALISAITLTIGIVLGYAYNIVYNYAFSDCDYLVDAIYGSEFWLDAVYSVMMMFFSAMSLLYILHRSFYGAINTSLDKVSRLWVNMTLTIVWIKVVVYKAYISNHTLCERKELEGYWCPVMERHYECDPHTYLKGTQTYWYYINKGLLNSAIISCASEFFPVLLVAHWLACGFAEEKAEDILKKREKKRGLRNIMKQFLSDISRVYSEKQVIDAPRLHPNLGLKLILNFMAFITALSHTIKWLVAFYYTMDFDKLEVKHWTGNEYRQWNYLCARAKISKIWFFVLTLYITLIASVFALILFLIIYFWARTLKSERLDAHHKAEARGDIIILFGCNIVLTLKLALQISEVWNQHSDKFLTTQVSTLRTISLVLIQITLWAEYLAVRRLLALNDRDIRSTRHFLPAVSLSGFVVGWVHFGMTFLDTSLIKYQLTDETYNFSQGTLVSMIFTQIIYPADYLFGFTVAGCWSDIILRYMQSGFFQLGPPRLVSAEVVHHLKEGRTDSVVLQKTIEYAVKRKNTGWSQSSNSDPTTEDTKIA